MEVDAGETSTFDVFSGVSTAVTGFCLVGVSRLLRMFTFPFVNFSAVMTSAGKFTNALLFVRYLSVIDEKINYRTSLKVSAAHPFLF